MVILVITRSSWSIENNAGSTLSNLFDTMPEYEYHSLYFRSDAPKNSLAQSYFHITEIQLMKSLAGSGSPGARRDSLGHAGDVAATEKSMYDRAKRWSGPALWVVRELLWLIGKWRSKSLREYVEHIRPDIVFMPAFDCVYPYRVLEHVASLSGASTVLFHVDDNYSCRRLRISPLFWLTRFVLRRHVRRAARRAALNYCISAEQRDEYSRTLGVECDLLWKVGDFSGAPPNDSALQSLPVESSTRRLVFTGNISSGRWETLLWIGEALDQMNANAFLEVYTHNTLTPKVERAFRGCDSIVLKGGVDASRVEEVQQSADVLVHVESLRRRGRLATRLSFSTKLVDYFGQAKCIFAVGWEESASIAYLRRNDAAIVASTRDQVGAQLERLLSTPTLIPEYGIKAWDCGRRNHSRTEVQQKLRSDFQRIAPVSGSRK